jgi:hypothetical protein
LVLLHGVNIKHRIHISRAICAAATIHFVVCRFVSIAMRVFLDIAAPYGVIGYHHIAPSQRQISAYCAFAAVALASGATSG